jgi:hypothetical protein
MTQTDPRLLLLNQNDNILVLRAAIDEGEMILVSGTQIVMKSRIGLGHKLSRVAIKAGDKILKYGAPIGSAIRDIAIGEHVHLENLKSDYTPTHSLDAARAKFRSKS